MFGFIKRKQKNLSETRQTATEAPITAEELVPVETKPADLSHSLEKTKRSFSDGLADIGVRSAMVGRWFFMGLGLISAVGTAMVFWLGGHMILRGVFTVGTIVAFMLSSA